VAFDEPGAVVPGSPLEQREPQILHVPEGPQPQQLLLQRADQPLDATVPLGSTDEGRARLDLALRDRGRDEVPGRGRIDRDGVPRHHAADDIFDHEIS